MVQLNTTYDSKIKEKIFILKGDEGYARTTDVVANLIAFPDYSTKLKYCHVGLEIEVLREFGGDSSIDIYINGEVKSIPWDSEHMDEIIDESWNNQGIYWEDGKLIFGKYETTPSLIEKGLYLPYDVEHTIKVRYNGNKYCLGSSAKPLVFTVPTPDKFKSILTVSSESPRFAPDTSVNIDVLLECEYISLEERTVKIYDGDTLVYTIDSLVQDEPATVNLGVLSDGLHNLMAVFEGDDEAMASKSSIYHISVGYNISQVQYTPALVTGTTGTLSCVVSDYFAEPWDDLSVKVSDYNGSTWSDISSSTTTDENGAVSFNTVQYNTNPFAVTIGNWHSRTYTTQIIYPSDISIQSSRELLHTQMSDSTFISGYLMSGDEPIIASGVHLRAYIYDRTGEIPVPMDKSIYTQDNGRYNFEFDGTIGNGRKSGIRRIVVMLYDDHQFQNSIDVPVVEYDWSSVRSSQRGSATLNGVSVSRTNNGFKVLRQSVGVSSISFKYDSNQSPSKIMEFDYVDGSLVGNDKIMGVSVSALSSPLIKGSRITVKQYYDEYLHKYVSSIHQNNQNIGVAFFDSSISFSFDLTGSSSSYIVFDNLIVYGGAEQ